MDEGWSLVTRKRGRTEKGPQQSYQRADIASNNHSTNGDKEVTYFFTHFSDDFGGKEMLRSFAYYGKVLEVVIPSKRDKFGRRFGFARLIEVSDPNLFATKLNNIFIGAMKLHVNTPRFSRDSYKERPCNVASNIARFGERNDQGAGEDCLNDPKGKKKVHEDELKGKEDDVSPRKGGGGTGSQKEVDESSRKGGGEAWSRREVEKRNERQNHFLRRRRRGDRKHRNEAHKGLLCYDVDEEVMEKFQKMYVG